MNKQDLSSAGLADAQNPVAADDDLDAKWRQAVGRRSFLKGVGLAGAAAVPGSALFASQSYCCQRSASISAVDQARDAATQRAAELEQWADLSATADFPQQSASAA